MLIRLVWFAWMCVGTAEAARQSPGFGGMRIVKGDVGFEGCLSQSGCASSFYRFLSEASMEQGFAMEGASVGSSALVHRHSGRFAGALIHTFPFAAPRENLSGKTENTSFSPVFPKLYAGVMRNKSDLHRSWSVSLLPPIPVAGAAALNLGVDGSIARTMADGRTRMGLDVDFTFVRATAPVTASNEQMESAEEEGFENNLDPDEFDERCDAERGCIDTFMVANLAIRGGFGWQLGRSWFPYAQVGLTVFDEFLYVEYDDTWWWGFGVQPTLHGGVAWAAADSVLLSAGTSAGLKQSNQNPSGGLGAFYKLTGSATYRF